MKQILLFAFLYLVATQTFSQSTFQKTYGDTTTEQAFHTIKTTDGGYIMAGQLIGGPGGYDIYIVKTDSNGVLEWTRTYWRPGIEQAASIAQTTDGGYIITGNVHGDTSWVYRAFLLKITGSGDQQWSKCYGQDYEGGSDVVQMPDKGYVVIGNSGTNSSAMHIYVFRTDSLGQLLWSRRVIGGGCCSYNDNGRSVHLTDDGGFILFGTAWFFGTDSPVTYYSKFSANDTLQWVRYIFYPGYCYSSSLTQTADRGFAILGNIPDGAYLYKVDSIGVREWAKVYAWTDTTSSTQVFGESLVQTNDGGFAFAGESQVGNNFLLKTDATGSLDWARMYGDTGYFTGANTLLQNSDGGFIIGGSTDASGAGLSDFYLTKTDSLGNSFCNDSIVSLSVSDMTSYANYGSTNIDTMGIQDTLVFQIDSAGIETVICYNVEGINHLQSQNNSISIFPNPFTDQTTLQSDIYLKDATINVYNAFGQQLKQVKNINGQTITFDRDQLPAGLYYLQLKQGNQTISVNKFIIAD